MSGAEISKDPGTIIFKSLAKKVVKENYFQAERLKKCVHDIYENL
jgi:hypothetical protein